MKNLKNVLVTGGAGYVGAVAVPKLLKAGHCVKVLDLFLYGDDVFSTVKPELQKNLELIKGDIRDQELLKKSLNSVDAVIHLACISNDPSFELNPDLGKSINLDSFLPLVKISKESGVKRFVYASSSSVYGLREESEVTEELKLAPLTDYSKFKAQCEEILLNEAEENFTCLIVRPATVCGYSPRLRLDLTVNILTNFAINKGEILVFGGTQKRPNIHIEDISEFYVKSLEWPHEKIQKKIYNVGYENFKVGEIAEMVKNVVSDPNKGTVNIKTVPTDDHRSYHVSSAKIANELGFTPKHTIEDAIKDLKAAFANGLIPDSLEGSKYFNIKRMQEVNLT